MHVFQYLLISPSLRDFPALQISNAVAAVEAWVRIDPVRHICASFVGLSAAALALNAVKWYQLRELNKRVDAATASLVAGAQKYRRKNTTTNKRLAAELRAARLRLKARASTFFDDVDAVCAVLNEHTKQRWEEQRHLDARVQRLLDREPQIDQLLALKPKIDQLEAKVSELEAKRRRFLGWW